MDALIERIQTVVRQYADGVISYRELQDTLVYLSVEVCRQYDAHPAA
jgi:hypothetical protein